MVGHLDNFSKRVSTVRRLFAVAVVVDVAGAL